MCQFYLRYPSAVKYQCLALYTGIGVDVKAGRRAGLKCKFGAESNLERAKKSAVNTGVEAADSNASAETASLESGPSGLNVLASLQLAFEKAGTTKVGWHCTP